MAPLSQKGIKVLEYRAKYFKLEEFHEGELIPNEMSRGKDNSYIGYGLVPEYYQFQNPLSEEQIEQVIQRYSEGNSTYDLAKEFNCHRSTISRALHAAGIEVNHKSTRRSVLCNKALQLYAEYMRPAGIGKELGIDATTVRKILHENNVRIRHSSEYKKDKQKTL